MKVKIITGSRRGTLRVTELKDEILGSDLVIHGDAEGVDRMADQIARLVGVHVVRVPALWKVSGNAAGSRRNEILAHIGVMMRAGGDAVRFAAFPAQDSRGTWHAIRAFQHEQIEGQVYEP